MMTSSTYRTQCSIDTCAKIPFIKGQRSSRCESCEVIMMLWAGLVVARVSVAFVVLGASSVQASARATSTSVDGLYQASGAATTATTTMLTLVGAEMLCGAALAEAQRLRLKPVSVAVVNAAGQLLVHKVQDGAPGLVADLALAKARSCLALNIPTRTLRDSYAQAKPTQLNAMGAVAGGQLAPFPGASAPTLKTTPLRRWRPRSRPRGHRRRHRRLRRQLRAGRALRHYGCEASRLCTGPSHQRPLGVMSLRARIGIKG